VFILFAGLCPAGETPQSDKVSEQLGPATVTKEQNAAEIEMLKQPCVHLHRELAGYGTLRRAVPDR